MSTAGITQIVGFRGELLRPQDAGYGEARRLWNGAIDKRPAVIARCTGAADVMVGISYARSSGLPLAVRGGGHNVAGTASCDDGIVLDLSPMKQLRIDPTTRTAWAQPGLLWGELDQATQALGLATTGGIVTHTGVAGLTLGGGIGWLMRKHGLTCDNLLEAELVTADGRLLRVDGRELPELLWGIRGGGGNFGVVTRFRFRLHRVGPQVLAGPVLYPAEQARPILRGYRDWAAGAPDEVSTVVNLRLAPPLEIIPEHLHGVPVVAIVCCYAGADADAGERMLGPLRRLGTRCWTWSRSGPTRRTRRPSMPPWRTACTTTGSRTTWMSWATRRSTPWSTTPGATARRAPTRSCSSSAGPCAACPTMRPPSAGVAPATR
jgi:FAD/FMN-containing dehydrogenase